MSGGHVCSEAVLTSVGCVVGPRAGCVWRTSGTCMWRSCVSKKLLSGWYISSLRRAKVWAMRVLSSMTVPICPVVDSVPPPLDLCLQTSNRHQDPHRKINTRRSAVQHGGVWGEEVPDGLDLDVE